jgi:hypothetical protein
MISAGRAPSCAGPVAASLRKSICFWDTPLSKRLSDISAPSRIWCNQIQPKAVEDWLHTTFDSWWTMHGVRAIMSRVFYYAEGHGLWEEGRRSPASKAKLGKKVRSTLTFSGPLAS